MGLSVSSTFNPILSADLSQRFLMNSNNEVQVATEGLGGRILSFLGKLPGFSSIEAVKAHVNEFITENKATLQRFVDALAHDNPVLERAIKDCLDMSGATPLTGRVLKQVKQHIDTLQSSVRQAADGLKAVISQHGSNCTNLVANHGNNIEVFCNMISGLKALAECKEQPIIAEYASILLKGTVGGQPFSEWEKQGWGVSTMLRSSDPKKFGQMAKQLQEIFSEVNKLSKAALEFADGKEPTLKRGDWLTHFRNIMVEPTTQVKLADGCPMPANTLYTGGTPVALVGSYPKSASFALEAHLRMLVEQNCSQLVVLAGDAQIKAENGLPVEGRLFPYFKLDGSYGDVTVKSDLIKSHTLYGGTTPEPTDMNDRLLPEGDGTYFRVAGEALNGPLVVNQYELTITIDGINHTLPVLNATNWPDHGVLKDSTQLEELANLMKGDEPDAIYANPNGNAKGLPFVQCKGAVGRTNTALTALEMINNPSAIKDPSEYVASIIQDFKASRNNMMGEDKGQVQQLELMAQRLQNRTLENRNSDYDEDEDFVDTSSFNLNLNSDSESLYSNRSEYQRDDLYANADQFKSQKTTVRY